MVLVVLSLRSLRAAALLSRHTCICKDLLRKVVYELAVDEAVDAMTDNLLALLPHLLLLSCLNLAHLHVLGRQQRHDGARPLA